MKLKVEGIGKVASIILITLFLTIALLNNSVFAYNWDIETIESGRVGFYSSITTDNDGFPHISYHDLANGILKYAYWDGNNWNIECIDSSTYIYSTSIAIDSNGYAHISYDCVNLSDSTYDLKYAKNSKDGWQIEIVDNDIGTSLSMKLDKKDYPHICYKIDRGPLKYARWDGIKWIRSTIDEEGDNYLEISMALDSNNYPHVCYMQLILNDLVNVEDNEYNMKYAKWDNQSWQFHFIERNDPFNASLRGISIALDTNDLPHICYSNGSTNHLIYVKWDGDNWIYEVVDDESNVAYPCLALDSNDYAHICYIDYYYIFHPDFYSNIKYAKWTGSNWSREIVNSEVDEGSYTSIAVDSKGYTHICYQERKFGNHTNGALKYTKAKTFEPIGFSQLFTIMIIISIIFIIIIVIFLFKRNPKSLPPPDA